jgi:hypothetical protein
MDAYEKILVVFLSAALAILLALSIVVLIKLIKIINRVNRMSQKAELAVEKFSDIGAMVQRFAGPLMVGKFMAKKFKASKRTKRGKDA